MAHLWLLLAPTAVTDTLTSADCCYCWTRGTLTVAGSAHSSDGHSDISNIIVTVGHVAHMWLLLAPTAAMGGLTSVDRCYCWIRCIRAVATSTHSSYGHWHQQTVATVGHVAHARVMLELTAMMCTLTSVNHCYCWTRGTRTVAASVYSSDEHSDISGPLLLLDTWQCTFNKYVCYNDVYVNTRNL
jgi:hypothetical protein